MQDLIAFVGDHGNDQFNTHPLDASAMAPRNASKASYSDWQEWTAKECAEVDRLCGPLMDRFGYPRLLEEV
jgi:hypothetical protein